MQRQRQSHPPQHHRFGATLRRLRHYHRAQRAHEATVAVAIQQQHSKFNGGKTCTRHPCTFRNVEVQSQAEYDALPKPWGSSRGNSQGNTGVGGAGRIGARGAGVGGVPRRMSKRGKRSWRGRSRKKKPKYWTAISDRIRQEYLGNVLHLRLEVLYVGGNLVERHVLV